MSTGEADTMEKISIHALREEGDSGKMLTPGLISISIHALREEGDHHGAGHLRQPENFNPRPPRGGRPTTGFSSTTGLYFNPRPPRGGRRSQCQRRGRRNSISIHALREEGDKRELAYTAAWNISIHALREEGDYQTIRFGT